jgi:hypothetical protein
LSREGALAAASKRSKDMGMRTAWVPPGGSTFDAIQGVASALLEAGIEPDLLMGTFSEGSLNAAWLAGAPTSRGATNCAICESESALPPLSASCSIPRDVPAYPGRGPLAG